MKTKIAEILKKQLEVAVIAGQGYIGGIDQAADEIVKAVLDIMLEIMSDFCIYKCLVQSHGGCTKKQADECREQIRKKLEGSLGMGDE